MSWLFLVPFGLVAAVILGSVLRVRSKGSLDLWGLVHSHEMLRVGAIIISLFVVPAALVWAILREGFGHDWPMEILVLGLSLIAIPFMYCLEVAGFNILLNATLASSGNYGNMESSVAEGVFRNLRRYRRIQRLLFRLRGRDLNEVLEAVQQIIDARRENGSSVV